MIQIHVHAVLFILWMASVGVGFFTTMLMFASMDFRYRIPTGLKVIFVLSVINMLSFLCYCYMCNFFKFTW